MKQLKNGTKVILQNTSCKDLDGKICYVKGVAQTFPEMSFYIVEFEDEFLYNNYSCISITEYCINQI